MIVGRKALVHRIFEYKSGLFGDKQTVCSDKMQLEVEEKVPRHHEKIPQKSEVKRAW